MSGTPARIPSRLGEPGSLFSRYKFLQLRLVVVMLLTRTRRELLKRRTIGARTYPAASLNRASRATPFVTAANPPSPPSPSSSHLDESSSCASFHRLRLLTPVCAPSSEVLWLWSYTQRISILNVCVICIPVQIPTGVLPLWIFIVSITAAFPLCTPGKPNYSGPRNILLWRAK